MPLLQQVELARAQADSKKAEADKASYAVSLEHARGEENRRTIEAQHQAEQVRSACCSTRRVEYYNTHRRRWTTATSGSGR